MLLQCRAGSCTRQICSASASARAAARRSTSRGCSEPALVQSRSCKDSPPSSSATLDAGSARAVVDTRLLTRNSTSNTSWKKILLSSSSSAFFSVYLSRLAHDGACSSFVLLAPARGPYLLLGWTMLRGPRTVLPGSTKPPRIAWALNDHIVDVCHFIVFQCSLSCSPFRGCLISSGMRLATNM